MIRSKNRDLLTLHANNIRRPSLGYNRSMVNSQDFESSNKSTNSFMENVYKQTNDPIDRMYQDILDNIIGEKYLTEICDTNDLSNLKTLQLHIDTSAQSIFEIHHYLPKLESLVLDDSRVSSIRDLGIGLRYIRHLSLFRCSLHDLDGIGVLVGIEDLNIEDNFLSDLYPLAMHENLQRLNASGNKISDLSLADTLSTCPNLRSLSLQRNPIARVPNYRLIVASLIPLIERLDGLPVDSEASSKVTNAMVLEAASAATAIAEEVVTDMYDYHEDSSTSSMTNHSYSYSTSASVSTSAFTSASASDRYMGSIPDTGSELTHGSNVVLAGNAALAIRRRHSSKTDPESGSSTSRALDIFDNVLSGNTLSPNSNSNSSSNHYHHHAYFKEGDITDIISRLDEDHIDLLSTVKASSIDRQVSQSNSETTESPPRRHSRRPSSTGSWTGSGSIPSSNISNSKLNFLDSTKTQNNDKDNQDSNNNSDDVMIFSSSASNHRPSTTNIIQSSVIDQLSPVIMIERAAIGRLEDNDDMVRSRLSSRGGFRTGPTDLSSFSSSSSNPTSHYKRPPTTRPSSSSSSYVKPIVPSRSIVHMDVIRRRTKGNVDGYDDINALVMDNNDNAATDDADADDSSSSNGSNGRYIVSYGNDENDEDDDSSDEDDIVISHAARYQLMSSRGRRSLHTTYPASSFTTTTSNSTSVQTIPQSNLQSTVQGNIPQDFYEVMGSRPSSRPSSARGGTRPMSTGSSIRSDDNSKVSSSTLAGKSLGFDFHGSLNAIEQWAGASEISDEDENNNVTVNQITLPSVDSLPSSLTSKSLSELISNRQKTSGNEVTKKSFILHRDKIIDMFVKEDSSTSTTATSSVYSDTISMNTNRKTSPSQPEHDSPLEKKLMDKRTEDITSSTLKKIDSQILGSSKTKIKTQYSTSNSIDSNSNNNSNSSSKGLNHMVKHSTSMGEGVLLSDSELIIMLQKPPKTVIQLRTKSSFQAFFHGIDMIRMRRLLEAAYSDITNEIQRNEKVTKRLELLSS